MSGFLKQATICSRIRCNEAKLLRKDALHAARLTQVRCDTVR
jgi:hypothetical protein